MIQPTTHSLYRIFGILLFGLLCFTIILQWHKTETFDFIHKRPNIESTNDLSQSSHQHKQVAVVIASQRKDNTSWLTDAFPDWDHQIYTTDDSNAALTVPLNKGREGMVYLTHIIDNYDNLAPVTIFRHADRYQWHSDDPLYDGLRVLRRLQIPYILQQGYTSLRCVWTLGCQVEIRPHLDEAQRPSPDQIKIGEGRTGWYYKEAFEYLFPDEEVPEEVGAPCCAQFAVTDSVIRQRPKSDYERYRQWLMETELSDYVSGRIMEYSWHIIFGQHAVSCPNAPACYCKLYGLCDLTCESAGVCKSQYTLPTYSQMPKGWPDFGWDGEWQNVTNV